MHVGLQWVSDQACWSLMGHVIIWWDVPLIPPMTRHWVTEAYTGGGQSPRPTELSKGAPWESAPCWKWICPHPWKYYWQPIERPINLDLVFAKCKVEMLRGGVVASWLQQISTNKNKDDKNISIFNFGSNRVISGGNLIIQMPTPAPASAILRAN